MEFLQNSTISIKQLYASTLHHTAFLRVLEYPNDSTPNSNPKVLNNSETPFRIQYPLVPLYTRLHVIYKFT